MSGSAGGAAQGTPSPGRRTLLLLGLLVIVVQLGLMLAARIPAPHNGGDNAGYLALGYGLTTDGYVELWDPATPPHTKYPPVFPALLAVWMALGATTWTALKTLPALFTTLAVLVAYLWVAQRRTPLFGAGVAIVVGASSAMLWYSQWLLSEPPFLTFTFLALWALERADSRAKGEPGSPPDPSGPFDVSWWVLGVAAAILASFTRSAGLPLLVAIGIWLALRRRGRLLAVFAGIAGLPALLWWLRAQAAGNVQYVSELWMVDPYRPELGQVGVGGMVARVWENLQGYVVEWIPEGLVGGPHSWAPVLGMILCVTALLGWFQRARGGPGPAELFFPLYAGLILVWPQAWSGDRFALPLFPLILFYSAEAVLATKRRIGVVGARALAGGAFTVLLVMALGSWTAAVEGAAACRAAFRAGGSFACYGPRWAEFSAAAEWSRANLLVGSVVLSRKPRIFYLTSGLKGRTYPFTADPDAFLAEASVAGASHVLLDHLDAQGQVYVEQVVRTRPEAFCFVQSFSAGQGGRPTQLLGLVPPESRVGGRITEDDSGRPTIALPPCPPLWTVLDPTQPLPLEPGAIPLISGRN